MVAFTLYVTEPNKNQNKETTTPKKTPTKNTMKQELKYQHKLITELKWSIDKSCFIFYKEY